VVGGGECLISLQVFVVCFSECACTGEVLRRWMGLGKSSIFPSVFFAGLIH
jgi:hypothetical protein